MELAVRVVISLQSLTFSLPEAILRIMPRLRVVDLKSKQNTSRLAWLSWVLYICNVYIDGFKMNGACSTGLYINFPNSSIGCWWSMVLHYLQFSHSIVFPFLLQPQVTALVIVVENNSSAYSSSLAHQPCCDYADAHKSTKHAWREAAFIMVDSGQQTAVWHCAHLSSDQSSGPCSCLLPVLLR